METGLCQIDGRRRQGKHFDNTMLETSVPNKPRSSSATVPQEDTHLYDADDTTYEIAWNGTTGSWSSYRPVPYADRDGDVRMISASSDDDEDAEMQNVHYMDVTDVEMEDLDNEPGDVEMEDANNDEPRDVEMEDLDDEPRDVEMHDIEYALSSMSIAGERTSQPQAQSSQLDGICEFDIDNPIIHYSAGVSTIRPVSSSVCNYENVDDTAFEVEILNADPGQPVQRQASSSLSPRLTSMSLGPARTGKADWAHLHPHLLIVLDRPVGCVRAPMRCTKTVTLEFKYEEVCIA